MQWHNEPPVRPSFYNRIALLGLAAITIAAVTGCGDGRFPTAPVSGSVTLDGKPLTNGTVIFTPKQGWPAQGTLDSEGRFTLTTYNAGDGAILGPNQVVVIAVTEEDPNEHFERPPSRPVQSLIPERYGNQSTSGLSHEVKADGPNEVQLELVSKAQKQ